MKKMWKQRIGRVTLYYRNVLFFLPFFIVKRYLLIIYQNNNKINSNQMNLLDRDSFWAKFGMTNVKRSNEYSKNVALGTRKSRVLNEWHKQTPIETKTYALRRRNFESVCFL